MKHLLRLCAALMVSCLVPAYAQRLITADVASAGTTFYGMIGPKGDILACIRPRSPADAKAEPCSLSASSSRKMGVLVPMLDLVPAGRTYVGFGIVEGNSYGTTYYIYWK